MQAITSERDDIIRTAVDLFGGPLPVDDGAYGRFELCADVALGYAIDIIDGHGLADDSYGSVDSLEGYFARVGQYMLRTDSQGFKFTMTVADRISVIRADIDSAYRLGRDPQRQLAELDALADVASDKPQFILTEHHVIQELGEDGNYHLVARAADDHGSRLVALLNSMI